MKHWTKKNQQQKILQHFCPEWQKWKFFERRFLCRGSVASRVTWRRGVGRVGENSARVLPSRLDLFLGSSQTSFNSHCPPPLSRWPRNKILCLRNFFLLFLCACVAFDWTLIDQKGRRQKKRFAAKMCFLKTIKNLIFVATRLEQKGKRSFCTVWTILAWRNKQWKVTESVENAKILKPQFSELRVYVWTGLWGATTRVVEDRALNSRDRGSNSFKVVLFFQFFCSSFSNKTLENLTSLLGDNLLQHIAKYHENSKAKTQINKMF